MKRIYVGIVRDHSGSMCHIADLAMDDFNFIIDQYRIEEGDDTEVYLSSLGFSTTPGNFDNFCLPIRKASKLMSYPVQGTTALCDSVADMIDHLSSIPKDNDTQFILMVQTDGDDNASVRFSPYDISRMISHVKNLTVTLRMPKTSISQRFASDIGVSPGNVYFLSKYDSVEFSSSTAATVNSISTYMRSAKAGVKATSTFYTDLSNVSTTAVSSQLTDVSSQVLIFTTTAEEVIKPFVERVNHNYKKGVAHYELTKPEREVQDYKNILIRDKMTGTVYAGKDARQLLGLPYVGTCKIVPGNHSNFEIFIQSTSINRKLPKNTKLALWDPNDSLKAVPVKVTATPAKPLATKAPVSTKKRTSDYVAGFADGKSHKKKKFPNCYDYIEGYADGRLSSKGKERSK